MGKAKTILKSYFTLCSWCQEINLLEGENFWQMKKLASKKARENMPRENMPRENMARENSASQYFPIARFPFHAVHSLSI